MVKRIYHFLLVLIPLLSCLDASAQRPRGNDSLTVQISEHLAISYAKATLVKEALEFNSSQIEAIIREQGKHHKMKGKAITQLLKERDLKLRDLLDSSQIEKLYFHLRPLSTPESVGIESVKRRNEEARGKQMEKRRKGN